MNSFATHSVENTSTPFENVNLYACDLALQESLRAQGGSEAEHTSLLELGQQLGQADIFELARQANQAHPRLQQYDRRGQRIDEVEFHPAWHQLMALLIQHGAHAMPWRDAGQVGAGSHLQRAAAYILFGQVENGSQCPTTMTFAAVPALRHAPAIAAAWLPKILSAQYDPRSLPIAQKHGALLGMGMTEKQGGSDVRANTTRATSTGEHDAWGERYQIVGHKWFFSAPQCDAHLILAQTESGLSCFFLPRYLPDGSRNAIVVQRLKEKLGNRSNASSEVEFCNAIAYPVGPIGRGVATIMEMGGHTRLDCVLGSAGIMRAALSHALHHARERKVFGRQLAAQPLMQNVLADLALESEAATVFAMRLAACFDHAEDVDENALGRLITAAGKYWMCKRGPTFGPAAMEVLGGNGYVEDGPFARWYREFPVNSIWEGSGNVMCLDVLRVLGKSEQPKLALQALLQRVQGKSAVLDAYASALLAQIEDLASNPQAEHQARDLAMRIVLATQAALLLEQSPALIADAFIASRIATPPQACFGNLPSKLDCAQILLRALPITSRPNQECAQ